MQAVTTVSLDIAKSAALVKKVLPTRSRPHMTQDLKLHGGPNNGL
jgi:hypothetical protein